VLSGLMAMVHARASHVLPGDKGSRHPPAPWLNAEQYEVQKIESKLQPAKSGELCSCLIQRDRGFTARVAILDPDQAIRKIGL